MLDRNVTKYIKINDRVIIAGQNSGGIWYIKELPAENPSELEGIMGECNRICNKYNNGGSPILSPKKK